MAASRLNDSQKQELVQRFRQGESSAALAEAYGCSPNTVTRTVKAAIDAAEYEQLKQQRGKAGALPEQEAEAEAVAAASPPSDPSEPELRPAMAAAVQELDEPDLRDPNPDLDGDDPDADDAAVLAIDDADDFGDDDDTSEDPEASSDDDGFTAVAVLPLAVNHEPVEVLPLVTSCLPDSLYMLVDKTVELQAKPLREFVELGQLPPDEQDRQALQLFANPRQAKRQCGRSQRVIKMPDPDMLVRRASYLQIKGISRLVVEGNLYALPGS